MSWSVAQHNTIPSVNLWLNPPDTHVYLSGFLDAAGSVFVPPYEPVREVQSRSLIDQVDTALTAAATSQRRYNRPANPNVAVHL